MHSVFLYVTRNTSADRIMLHVRVHLAIGVLIGKMDLFDEFDMLDLAVFEVTVILRLFTVYY